MTVQISFNTREGITIIGLSGRFVGKEAEDFIKQVDDYFSEQQDVKLVIDLSRLEYIGSQGASAFMVLSDKYQLKIASPLSTVQNTLNLLKLDSVLGMYDTVDKAIDAFKKG